jgi:hypothetical protein
MGDIYLQFDFLQQHTAIRGRSVSTVRVPIFLQQCQYVYNIREHLRLKFMTFLT